MADDAKSIASCPVGKVITKCESFTGFFEMRSMSRHILKNQTRTHTNLFALLVNCLLSFHRLTINFILSHLSHLSSA